MGTTLWRHLVAFALLAVATPAWADRMVDRREMEGRVGSAEGRCFETHAANRKTARTPMARHEAAPRDGLRAPASRGRCPTGPRPHRPERDSPGEGRGLCRGQHAQECFTAEGFAQEGVCATRESPLARGF